jgi:hypothetical protein
VRAAPGRDRHGSEVHEHRPVLDGDLWRVQCIGHPAAISLVTRLEDAAAHQREAIAFVVGVPESDVEVEIVLVPPVA